MTKQVQVRLHGITTYVDDSVVDSYTAGIQHHADALLPLLDYAGSVLKPDDLVFDVGANIGLTTIGLARLVPDGNVLAFEPSSLNAARLRRNLAANNITNVDVVEAAVSSHDRGLHFVDTAESGSASHVLPFTSDTNVRSVALDAHRHTREDGRGPAFIKIDVEGHEPWVLDSGARLIGECRPILWMEFNSWCLMAFGSINPLEFAEALFDSFSMTTTTDGKNMEPISDHLSFVHRNIVKDGCVTDVILQARDVWPSQTTFAGGGGGSNGVTREAACSRRTRGSCSAAASWRPRYVRSSVRPRGGSLDHCGPSNGASRRPPSSRMRQQARVARVREANAGLTSR